MKQFLMWPWNKKEESAVQEGIILEFPWMQLPLFHKPSLVYLINLGT